jgi:hypothetical protein
MPTENFSDDSKASLDKTEFKEKLAIKTLQVLGIKRSLAILR